MSSNLITSLVGKISPPLCWRIQTQEIQATANSKLCHVHVKEQLQIWKSKVIQRTKEQSFIPNIRPKYASITKDLEEPQSPTFFTRN